MSYYQGHPFLYTESRQGYQHHNDITHFLLDTRLCNVPDTERIMVTGDFRQWGSSMDDHTWDLHKHSKHLWVLSVFNPRFLFVPKHAQFRFLFLIDGVWDWVAVPADAPNIRDNNLCLEPQMPAPRLYAELRREKTLWVKVDGVNRSFDPQDYRLTDAKGQEIAISSALPQTEEWTLVSPAETLDIRRVYYLEMPKYHLRTVCSFDGWFRDLCSHKELGANVDDGKTAFRVFAPRADLVKLYLYEEAEDTEPIKTVEMTLDIDGVWEYIADESLLGIYYDFTVHGPDEPGNHFYETTPVHISDPYARVSVDSWGKSRVWQRGIPATPLENGIPAMEDVIAYEVHVQDFTDLLPVSEDLKGTLPAMYTPGLKNSQGQPIGFDYLTELGINVVHLMPVQEFLHYKDENWRPAFEHDPYMIEQGINEENYQWGYRTSHCFAIETRFRQKGTQHGAQREQFRDLVQAFHDRDIAVIIDIVPNHTAENMDKKPYFFHFNVLDKQYYYRTKMLEHIGEYGNEVKTENRPMVQRWLIEQCKHMIEEFGIDGFRIDLAGQIDRQTLTALRIALGPDIIIYGEPWIGSFDPDFENNPNWDWYKADSPITYFQDEARNAFKGPTSPPKDKRRDRGFAGGNANMRDAVKFSLCAGFPEDRTPNSGINYLDIHDNWALADRFAKYEWDGRYGVEEERYKLAAVLLYTSLGPIVTHGGTEMMRSKGVAPLVEVVKPMVDGTLMYAHGKRDTYNLRKANQFVWENVGKTFGDEHIFCDYKGMLAFWKSLNEFRMGSYGKAFRRGAPAPEGYYQWIEPENKNLLGYIVDQRIMILLNVDDQAHYFASLLLPKGSWRLVGNTEGIDLINGMLREGEKDQRMGEKSYDFSLPGSGFEIWINTHLPK